MIDKIKAMLGSVSFWFSVAGAIVLLLGQYGIISQEVAVVIAGWFGVGITKRTVDRFRK